eukprot:1160317-Pelagomonas_calceolata.AAC.7
MQVMLADGRTEHGSCWMLAKCGNQLIAFYISLENNRCSCWMLAWPSIRQNIIQIQYNKNN